MVVTRFQKNRNVYAQVFENPLLLSLITSSLNETDIVNLSLTNKKFHPKFSHIGDEVIQPQLDECYEEYIRDKEEKQSLERDMKFVRKLVLLIQKQEHKSNYTNTARLFDYIVKFKEHIMSMKQTYAVFLNTLENKLINFVLTNEGGFAADALHYLFTIFDISVKVQSFHDDDLFEYIVTTKGEYVYI